MEYLSIFILQVSSIFPVYFICQLSKRTPFVTRQPASFDSGRLWEASTLPSVGTVIYNSERFGGEKKIQGNDYSVTQSTSNEDIPYQRNSNMRSQILKNTSYLVDVKGPWNKLNLRKQNRNKRTISYKELSKK